MEKEPKDRAPEAVPEATEGITLDPTPDDYEELHQATLEPSPTALAGNTGGYMLPKIKKKDLS